MHERINTLHTYFSWNCTWNRNKIFQIVKNSSRKLKLKRQPKKRQKRQRERIKTRTYTREFFLRVYRAARGDDRPWPDSTMRSTKNTRTGQTGSLLRLREVWTVHTIYPPPLARPLFHRTSSPSPRRGKREQRDRVFKLRRIVSIERIESKTTSPVNRLIAEFEQAISFLELLRERSIAKVGHGFRLEEDGMDARSHECPSLLNQEAEDLAWSGKLAWFVVEFFDIPPSTTFRDPLIIIAMIRDRWFSGKNVLDFLFVATIFELRDGCWVSFFFLYWVFLNCFFFFEGGRVCFHGFMKYWKILVSARIK